MPHDDDDWDSSIAEGILDFLLYADGKLSGPKLSAILFLIVLGLGLWHYFGE